MFFKKDRNSDLETYRDITDDVEESEFVPYACLFDAHTIITKNGELLQTIKITGSERDNLGEELPDLRVAIRNAVRDHIPSNDYAIWFHTLRREKDLSVSGEFTNEFSAQVDAAWEDKNQFKKQFTNEVYLTFVREGQAAEILDKASMARGWWPKKDLKWRNEYLDNIFAELNGVVENIVGSLQFYGCKRLGVYEKDGVYYSDQLRFLEKLTNLLERPMPVPMEDLSEYLTSGEVTFGYNAMEVRTDSGRRRFASIVTVKEYKEASLPAIDSFLQAPIEFIVTQCLDFINPDIALSQYKEQKRLLEASGDEWLAEVSELDAILAGDRGRSTDFGEQQLSIFIQADTVRQLESYTRKAITHLSKYGVIAFREDLKFEECYWSQLPGNFEFLCRLMPTNTMHVAGFANLHNYPVGELEDLHWGQAVSSFHTAMGTPYFFNFHQGDNGHTTIVGPHGAGKTVLMNFLLTQVTKFNPNIYYFDISCAASLITEKLGGTRYSFTEAAPAAGEPAAALNPFSAEPTPDYVAFLVRWMSVLVRMGGGLMDDETKALVKQAVEYVFGLDRERRNFAAFIDHLTIIAPAKVALFVAYVPGSTMGHLFSHANDVFDTPQSIASFDLYEIAEQPMMFVPIVSYLLQRVTMQLKGERSILVLDEAWELLKNSHISLDIVSWMQHLTRQNAFAVCMTERIEQSGMEPITEALIPATATQIYLPDPEPGAVYVERFGLDELELAYIGAMDSDQRHFLLKQGDTSIVAEMNLEGMDDAINVFVGRVPRKRTVPSETTVAEEVI